MVPSSPSSGPFSLYWWEGIWCPCPPATCCCSMWNDALWACQVSLSISFTSILCTRIDRSPVSILFSQWQTDDSLVKVRIRIWQTPIFMSAWLLQYGWVYSMFLWFHSQLLVVIEWRDIWRCLYFSGVITETKIRLTLSVWWLAFFQDLFEGVGSIYCHFYLSLGVASWVSHSVFVLLCYHHLNIKC